MRLLLVILLLLAMPVWAQTSVSSVAKQIDKWGAHSRTFSPVAFVDEEKLFIGLDEPPFTIKRKGITRRLWLVRLDAAMKVESVKNIDLRLGSIDQAKLTPDHKSMVVVSKRGTQVDLVRLSDGQITNLATHTKGQPGFRVSPLLVFSSGSKFYALGYPYDANDFAGNSTIAEVDLTLSGASAFRPVVALDKLQDGVPNTTVRSLLSPEGVFFVSTPVPEEVLITRWTPAGGYQAFDKGKRYTGSWGAQEFLIYALNRLEGGNELLLGNAKTGEKKVLASSPTSFVNPVLGQEGGTWITLVSEGDDLFSVLAGSDRDPVVKRLRQHVPPCVLRVGTLGETVVTHALDGELTIYKMP